MDYELLCPNCMKIRITGSRVCPYCGFDSDRYRASAEQLPPYKVLHDKYVLGKAIGSGGFGITYIAYDKDLQISVAVKELFLRNFCRRDPDGSVFTGTEDSLVFEESREQFLKEARVLAMFQDSEEGIVKVKEYFEENRTAYIVMEFLKGTTLKRMVEERPLGFYELQKIMYPVARSLTRIHQFGVIHKDVSPDNIMLLENGKVKLLDFGGAASIYEEESAFLSSFKYGYTPVEQFHRDLPLGPWTDVYSLAATMYYALSGVRPPDARELGKGKELRSLSSMRAGIPASSEKAIRKAMETDPLKRYQTVEEFWNDVQRSFRPQKLVFSILLLAAVLFMAFWYGFRKPEKGNGLEPGAYALLCQAQPEAHLEIDSGFGDDGAFLTAGYGEPADSGTFLFSETEEGLYTIRAAHTGSYLVPEEPGNEGVEDTVKVIQVQAPEDMEKALWRIETQKDAADAGEEDGTGGEPAQCAVIRPAAGDSAVTMKTGEGIRTPGITLNRYTGEDNQIWMLEEKGKEQETETGRIPVHHEGEILDDLQGEKTFLAVFNQNYLLSVSSNPELETQELILWENVWDSTQRFELVSEKEGWYRIRTRKDTGDDNVWLEYDPSGGKIILNKEKHVPEQMFRFIYSGYNTCLIQTSDSKVLGFLPSENGGIQGNTILAKNYEEYADPALVKWIAG